MTDEDPRGEIFDLEREIGKATEDAEVLRGCVADLRAELAESQQRESDTAQANRVARDLLEQAQAEMAAHRDMAIELAGRVARLENELTEMQQNALGCRKDALKAIQDAATARNQAAYSKEALAEAVRERDAARAWSKRWGNSARNWRLCAQILKGNHAARRGGDDA